MTTKHSHHSVVLEKVTSLIRSKNQQSEISLIEKFVDRLYGNMSHEDLVGRADGDLYGAALSLWHILQQHQGDEPTIRVFNPTFSQHGWQSNHTIVEIVIGDMPFLVDSVRMAFSRMEITSHLLLHSPLSFRMQTGEVVGLFDVDSSQPDVTPVTVFHIEVDRIQQPERQQQLTEELASVLNDVTLAVTDWQPMQAKLLDVIAEMEGGKLPVSDQEKKASLDFLRWTADHNLTLMGYRHYDIQAIEGDYELRPDPESSLGLMKASKRSEGRLLSTLPSTAREEALNEELLILTKTNSKSRVHRPAYIDYIGIKRFDQQGKVIGEDRFIGLYSASVYNRSATEIPLISAKLNKVLESSSFARKSHAYKALLNILETYPRDELIQASAEELLEVAMGVLQMQERDMTRLFVRKDPFGRFFSCMVYVTKERYNTQLRQESQKVLSRYFNSDQPVEFNTYFSESALARTQYIVHVTDNDMAVNVQEIEDNLREAARSWEDKLSDALIQRFGESEGKTLSHQYHQAFPRSYKEDVTPGTTVADVLLLKELGKENPLGMLFYQPQEEKEGSKHVRLKLYHQDQPIHLSDVLPMLENMGLRVIGERPYRVAIPGGETQWILEFHMEYVGSGKLKLDACQERFQEAFSSIWRGDLEDDGFNRLVLGAGLTGRQVTVLRAYAKYQRQIGSSFSQSYIENALNSHPHIAQQLYRLFEEKFLPGKKQRQFEKLHDKLIEALDQVESLDDDRIIRRYGELVSATLRTNFYQADPVGSLKPYVSLKIASTQLPEMPLPIPKFEVFVYSPRVEGVHLRGGKVARGGLRWSDRMEDFRTEILGLVKAQQVKNTVIVPVGAKGGFVCKRLPKEGGREAFFKEGQACYQTFIRGLLDITDNVVNGEVMPPKDVVRMDEDDPYLVVAADKGTATFSDIANAISEEYNFWLGDAFASGGSVGYDHKKMGITARGAWESVKRHFREIGVDCQNTDFTCIAVGDMSGDVFGNGMLLSKHTRLFAAFNHMHIFVDPDPVAADSYKERKRLFELPRSAWTDYNGELISKGGGIFSRAAKSIPLSPEMQSMLSTTDSKLTPNELIQRLLKLPVDLLWNGGIGTYVKGRDEHHAEVGDRSNDSVRINGAELQARIVGEGGNLGCTQKGRMEYAAKGGRINTDFIDNVGGVDCSDNEVNIKILLNGLVQSGDLTTKQRNNLLYQMTDEVSEIVLRNCYRQTQSLSVTMLRGEEQLKEHMRFIHAQERKSRLDRQLEHLPNDEELNERHIANKGLTRPEMSVLLAYAKMELKERLLSDTVANDPFYQHILLNAFPEVLQQRFADAMQHHPLKAEIIATRLANRLVNDMGLNFVNRMEDETGASAEEITACYSMARRLFDMAALRQKIESLDNRIPAIVQSEMLFQLTRIVRRACRWFLRHRQRNMSIAENIELYRQGFADLSVNLTRYLVEEEVEELHSSAAALVAEKVPDELARRVAQLSTIFSALDISQIAKENNRPISLVAEIYFKLGARLDLHWFLTQINNQPVNNHWQALARASFREELDWQQRSLASVVLRYCSGSCDADQMLAQWQDDYAPDIQRWKHMLAEFRTTQSHESAKFSVALRELMHLSHNCELAM